MDKEDMLATMVGTLLVAVVGLACYLGVVAPFFGD